MARSTWAAVSCGAASVTFKRRAMPPAVSCCSSRCTALSKSARTSAATFTDSVITKPVSVRTSVCVGRFPELAHAPSGSAASASEMSRSMRIARSLRLFVQRARIRRGWDWLGRRCLASRRGRRRRDRPRLRRLVRVAIERREPAGPHLELRVAVGLQHCEPREASLDPRVVDPARHELDVLLVYLERPLLEGARLGCERLRVLLELGGADARRALRVDERLAELPVDLRHVKGGGSGHARDLVVDQPAVGFERGVHAPLLLLHGLLGPPVD